MPAVVLTRVKFDVGRQNDCDAHFIIEATGHRERHPLWDYLHPQHLSAPTIELSALRENDYILTNIQRMRRYKKLWRSAFKLSNSINVLLSRVCLQLVECCLGFVRVQEILGSTEQVIMRQSVGLKKGFQIANIAFVDRSLDHSFKNEGSQTGNGWFDMIVLVLTPQTKRMQRDEFLWKICLRYERSISGCCWLAVIPQKS